MTARDRAEGRIDARTCRPGYIQVKTAGGGAKQGADMVLAGIRDAQDFRNRVLEQRERVASGATGSPERDPTVELLTEIRDSLVRLERALAQEGGPRSPQRP